MEGGFFVLCSYHHKERVSKAVKQPLKFHNQD